VTVRTTFGRSLAVILSVAMAHAAAPTAQAAPAAGHLVGAEDVAKRLLESARTREERVALFQAALATPEAQSAARAKGFDAGRLRAAVPHLSDRELADLARRAEKARDVVAGHRGDSSDGLVIVGLILLVAGIVVLAAVAQDEGWYDDCDCYY
jgi:hypothetical protein